MIRIYEFDTVEEAIEYKNQVAVPYDDIMLHKAQDKLSEFEDEQIVIEFETEEERINRALAPCQVRLTRGNSGSINVIGCTEFTKKRFDYCGSDLDKFREPVWIIKDILPNDNGRFYGDIYKEVCRFVDRYYLDPCYNRQKIIDYIGATDREALIANSQEHGGILSYLKYAHDYHKHNKLGGRSA